MAEAITSKREKIYGYGRDLKKERERQRIIRNLIAYIILTAGSVIMVAPFLWTLSASIKTPTGIFEDPGLIPNPKFLQSPWWQNYYEAWTSVPFAKYYRNSIIVSVVGTSLQLFTCTLAAFAFSRLRWPGRDVLFLGYLATMMIPGVVTMIPVYILMRFWGLVDTLWAVILPSAFSAYGTFLLRQFFVSIPIELEEAAMVDGANKVQILLNVIVPLSKGALATLGVFTFMWLWNDFMWPLVVLTSEEVKTLPIGLNAFQGVYGAQYHLLMAASLIVLVPVLLVYIAGQRFITESIMLTGFGGR